MINKIERPQKSTKIVATLGPASDDENTLRQMIVAGLDVVRLNFSHGDHNYLVPLIKKIRDLSQEMEVPIAILGDLRGPRIRVGEVKDGTVELKTGQEFTLTSEAIVGNSKRVSISYPHLARDVNVGSRILLDDGNIELEVQKIKVNGDVVCLITQGDTLSNHRGVNLPDSTVSLPSLTDKDYGDIAFAIEQELDFLALSFVQSAEDVRQLNEYLAENGASIPVIAKIERKNALEDIEAITEAAYGVMVARGDLALEMSIQEVPIAQKQIIATCRRAAVPVITATQMLESMMDMHKPTRAEATDVANAVLDGTDALMLSGETAIGKYPVETVATMATIASSVEKAWLSAELPDPLPLEPPRQISPTVAYAAYLSARALSAKAIIAYTSSGATARRIVCHRPAMPVLALTARPETQRRMALSWDIECHLTEPIRDTDHMIEVAVREAQKHGLAGPGEVIVIVAGMPPYGRSGRTNTLKIERIPTPDNHQGIRK